MLLYSIMILNTISRLYKARPIVAQFKSPTKHDGIIHPFPPKLSLFSKYLIGNIEAQNTNPDLMPLPWALPMVKIAGSNTLGHGLYPR
jgi:hypothetical protein